MNEGEVAGAEIYGVAEGPSANLTLRLRRSPTSIFCNFHNFTTTRRILMILLSTCSANRLHHSVTNSALQNLVVLDRSALRPHRHRTSEINFYLLPAPDWIFWFGRHVYFTTQ